MNCLGSVGTTPFDFPRFSHKRQECYLPNVDCVELALTLWFVVMLLVGYIIGRK
jgi:hypothetical protein